MTNKLQKTVDHLLAAISSSFENWWPDISITYGITYFILMWMSIVAALERIWTSESIDSDDRQGFSSMRDNSSHSPLLSGCVCLQMDLLLSINRHFKASRVEEEICVLVPVINLKV